MTGLLADHNIEGHARLLFSTLATLGWVELLERRLVTFAEAGLAATSSDREVWRRAQDLGLLLLTDNRNRSGDDSLQQTLLEKYTATSLPVLTVGRVPRLLAHRAYRQACHGCSSHDVVSSVSTHSSRDRCQSPSQLGQRSWGSVFSREGRQAHHPGSSPGHKTCVSCGWWKCPHAARASAMKPCPDEQANRMRERRRSRT